VDGGQFFRGDIVQIEIPERDRILLIFDEIEIKFLKDEAIENKISVATMVDTVFGLLFIGGYKTLTGKE